MAFSTLYPYFGLAGSLIITTAMVVTGIIYRGRKGERYSPLNHFISELGEVGVSSAATLFNSGLIVGGATLLPFAIGLGLALPTPWGILAMLAGCWAAISSLLVGIFPMNNLTPHVKVAMSYFRSGLATMLLFSLAIFLQPQGQRTIPIYAGALGLLGAGAYAFFIFGSRPKPDGEQVTDILDPAAISERPRVWKIAVMEWMVYAATLLWFLSVSLAVIAR